MNELEVKEDITQRFAFWPPFDVNVIMKILPHRFPFLLVDGITEFREDGVRGYKMLTMSEPHFQGHFPGKPIYPGVLQIETVAQVGACWILARKENVGKIAYLMSVQEAKFRRPAVPGMKLDVDGKITHFNTRSGRFEAVVTSDGKLVSNVTILFAFSKDSNGDSRD